MGKLPPPIPVTTSLTNPSHHIKIMSAPIFALAKGVGKNSRQDKKMDTRRIKKQRILHLLKYKLNNRGDDKESKGTG